MRCFSRRVGGEVCGLTDLSRCVQFIVECHGNTLLPQFLGMYRLTVDGDETYMIVTRNVFSHRLSVYKKYDLKVGGAWRKRNIFKGPRIALELTFLEILLGFAPLSPG